MTTSLFNPVPATSPVPAAGRAHQRGFSNIARLTTAARLANLRPAHALEVDDPATTRTDRLFLRPLRRTDRTEFVRALRASRDSLAQFCPLNKAEDNVITDDDIFERQLLLSDRALETGLAWRRVAIIGDGRIAGSIAINDIHRGLEHSGELVFWINTLHTGRGLAGECVRAAMATAFADVPRGLGLHRLTALVSPENRGSLSVLARAGFALSPAGVSIELILSGRRAPHDLYVAFAPLAEPVRPAHTDQRTLARALSAIMATEAVVSAAA